jgi:hypothetical protein
MDPFPSSGESVGRNFLITGRTDQYKYHVTLRVREFAEKTGNFSDKTVSHVVYTQEQRSTAITSEEILVM